MKEGSWFGPAVVIRDGVIRIKEERLGKEPVLWQNEVGEMLEFPNIAEARAYIASRGHTPARGSM